jgi:hypothetical protein
MLDISRCSFHDASDYPLANLVTKLEEGVPVMSVIEGGVAKVKAAAADNNDVFAGVVLNNFVSPTSSVYVETVTVPASAPFTVQLKKVAVAPNTDSLARLADGTVLTFNAAAGAGQYSIDTTTGVATFNTAQAGLKVTVTYRYNLSALDVQLLFGDSWPGNSNSPSLLGSVGVIRKGLVFTDKFDASKNWSSVTGATTIKATSGVFSFGGNGATVSGKIESVPNADVPFLGIRINA